MRDIASADKPWSIDQTFGSLDMEGRLSRPSPKRSLGATVRRFEKPVRACVNQLNAVAAIDEQNAHAIYGASVYGPGAQQEANELRFSWFLVLVAIAHAIATRQERVVTFLTALEWFFGEKSTATRLLSCFPEPEIQIAENYLRELLIGPESYDLLPYLIEPHGHVTRSELETCEIAQRRRVVKRVAGVYYTPSDVADFMVESLAEHSNPLGDWIDPACGTGVFLRAIIEYVKRARPDLAKLDLLNFATSRLYGIDRSALATELTSFIVYLACDPERLTGQATPFDLWRRIKQNFVCMDSLRLVPRMNKFSGHSDLAELAEITEIFPRVGWKGFDNIIMNPPYATVTIDAGLQANWHSFSGLAVGQSGDAHLGFTEMLWRLKSADGAAVAVLPLSIGTNTTKSYGRLRQELLRSPTKKEFLFFDREPQALFGEDIKTRNLVLTLSGCSDFSVQTSRLLKWTANQRRTIFRRDRLVPVQASHCSTFIPKLGSTHEKQAYEQLRSAHNLVKFVQHAPRQQRITLAELVNAPEEISQRMLVVSSTAYNFVNCFFQSGLPKESSQNYSSSPVNAMFFECERDATAAFAIVSSRLCYWLWHVEGDGFHLTSDFLRRLPLWTVMHSTELKDRLANHGKLLWEDALVARVGAVNSGRQTYSFHYGYENAIAEAVERDLLDYLGINSAFSEALDSFIHSTVSIDGTNRSSRDKLILRKVV